jgi:thioesterase domain-containing protein
MVTEIRERPLREVNLKALAAPPGAPNRSLVPLKPSGSAPPLFVVHGMFGEIFHFKRLAERIRDDIALYGLEARGLWGDVEPHHTIPEAAAAYIEEIRSVRPSGPYLIGGFSFGGMIAWEIAHQLTDAGEDVDLILFDVGPNTLFRRRRRREHPRSLWRNLTHPLRVATFHARNAWGLESQRRRAYLRQLYRDEMRRLGRRLGLGRNNRLYRASLRTGRQRPPGHLAIREAFRDAWQTWDWLPYRGHVTLIRARIQQPNDDLGPTLGLTPELTLGGIEVHHVTGHHDYIFVEPHVYLLAAALEGWVDRVTAGHAAVRQ